MSKSISQLKLLRTLEGVPAVNVLRLGADVRDGDTVSIGGRVYECDDQAQVQVVAGRVPVHVFNGYANATLNFDDTQNVVDGNTITIGTKVYTFKAVLTNVDGYVKIGPTIHRSIYNFVAALNVGNVGLYEPPYNYGALNDIGEGAGAAYAAAMTKNSADVEGGYGNDFDVTIAHRGGGASGNTIALDETLIGNASWAEGNLIAGVPHPTAVQFGSALATALNNDPLGTVFAEQVSASEVLVWSRRLGDVRLACASAFTSGANLWQWPTLTNGVAVREGLMPFGAARRVASAEEAAQGRMYFVFGFDPVGTFLQVRSGAGAHIAFDGGVTLQGRRVTVTSGAIAIAAGQVFNLIAFR